MFLEIFQKFTGKRLCSGVTLIKVADPRSAAFFKRDSSRSVFPWILRDFLEHLFCISSSYVIQNRCSKKSRKIHGKIHVNCCFWYEWEQGFFGQLMLCRIDCESVFKVLSLSTEMQFSADFALMSTQPKYKW